MRSRFQAPAAGSHRCQSRTSRMAARCQRCPGRVKSPPLRGNDRLMVLGGSLLAGRYQLDEPIGTGWFSEVWRATDTALSRPVAVKLLHPAYPHQAGALARFRAEALNAAALWHENIAHIYDYDEPAEGSGAQPYLVMELVDGPSL